MLRNGGKAARPGHPPGPIHHAPAPAHPPFPGVVAGRRSQLHGWREIEGASGEALRTAVNRSRGHRSGRQRQAHCRLGRQGARNRPCEPGATTSRQSRAPSARRCWRMTASPRYSSRSTWICGGTRWRRSLSAGSSTRPTNTSAARSTGSAKWRATATGWTAIPGAVRSGRLPGSGCPYRGPEGRRGRGGSRWKTPDSQSPA